jgi:opacity protein-like surface antigen
MNRKDFTRKHALALATLGFAPLSALGSLCLPAKGADFEQPLPPPAPTYGAVDFTSGWYVRADIAYAQETFPEIASSFPNVTLGSTPSVLNTFSTGAGMGYKVNDWFRTDLILDYRSPIQAAGIGGATPCFVPDAVTGVSPPDPATCTGHFNAEIHRWDLLANGYIDLGTWEGFTPYLGAGAGVAWAQTTQSVNFTLLNGVPCVAHCGFLDPAGTVIFSDFDSSRSSLRYQFAWALMAGVSIAVMDHVQIDVGYRFLDLGTISGTSATGATVTQRIIANEVRGGLRYMID